MRMERTKLLEPNKEQYSRTEDNPKFTFVPNVLKIEDKYALSSTIDKQAESKEEQEEHEETQIDEENDIFLTANELQYGLINDGRFINYYSTAFVAVLAMLSMIVVMLLLKDRSYVQFFVFVSLVFVLPAFFLVSCFNVIPIHNLYVPKYIEPVFIFCFALCMTILSIFFLPGNNDIGDRQDKKAFLVDNSIIGLLYTVCICFVLKYGCRFWVPFYRLESRLLLVLWLLCMYGYAQSLLVFSYWNVGGYLKPNEQILYGEFTAKQYPSRYILRSYVLMLLLSCLVWHNTFINRMFKAVYWKWLGFMQLLLFTLLCPVYYPFVKGHTELLMSFYMAINVLILLLAIELLVCGCSLWFCSLQNRPAKTVVQFICKGLLAVFCLGCVAVQSISSVVYWNDSAWALIDILLTSALVWLVHLVCLQYCNLRYVDLFTDFYTWELLSEYNFLGTEGFNKLHDIFVVRSYKYGCCGSSSCCSCIGSKNRGRFISMSSKMRAPWTANYAQLDSPLTHSLMVGIQASTRLHFDFKLRFRLNHNRLVRYQQRRHLLEEIPANREPNPSNVHARYEYGIGGQQLSVETFFHERGFSLVEYYPSKFAEIRAWSEISNSEYVATFTRPLLEFITNSKSGMYFFYTFDGKYLVKSLKKSEFQFFQRIFLKYFHFLRRNPNSFLNKFFGMYRLKMNTGKPKHAKNISITSGSDIAGGGDKNDVCFIVMESIFYSDLDVSKIYDLKGSTKGRELSEKEKTSMKVPVLKDLDFKDDGTRINIGPRASGLFVEQLAKDVTFLERMNIMDYSMLVGIHYRSGQSKHESLEQRATNLVVPYVFRYDHGGISGIGNNSEEVYFCGIIDILQRFNAKKKVENVVKRIANKQKEISCVGPDMYANRMYDFLKPYVV